ncbi:MAG: PKD domain-containing protein, partial [Patescibacteria group bacterium]
EELQQTDIKDKTIEVTSIVSAKFNDSQATVAKMTGIPAKANFTFRGTTTNANDVKIDFGDGESNETSVTSDKDGKGLFEFTHSYSRAGSYSVSITATSNDGNGENTTKKQVYVSGGDVPLAIMEVNVDGVPFVMDGTELEVIRNKPIKFSAKKSVDSNGVNDDTGRSQNKGLSFVWDFGDGAKSTTAEVTHSYEETSQEDKPYKVKLTVSEEADPGKVGTAEFTVVVASKKPQVNTISLEKKTPGETAPVEVILTAEGAIDPDGRITNYQFWYYDPSDKEQQLGIADVPADHATLTVETKGEEGQEHEYYFCVSVTDNENTVSSCNEMFSEDELPRVRVKNGPNKAPVASFSVDRTSAKVNDAVTFISSSKDEDGKLTKYIWDLEGDGFQNDNPTELSTVTYQYKKKSPRGGYRVKLKVIDNRGAAGFSKEQAIIIEPKSNSPTANFSYNVQDNRTVKFIDSSTFDSANGAKPAKWTWDFDTSQEFGCTDAANKPAYCNGNKSDDADSTDQNPVFVYPASGTYQVKLTVEDSDSNVSDPKTATISLIAGAAGGDQNPNSGILQAVLKSDPMYGMETIGGQQKKVLRIPANSNGQNVTLFWGDSTGNVANYKLDKNIWCDSDGNGNSSNDTDAGGMSASCQVASTGAAAQNCWTTNYQRYAWTRDPRGAGNFTTLLTVTDRAGKTSTDTMDVIFDGSTDSSQMIRGNCSGTPSLLGGSLFTALGTQNTILLSVVSGVILVLIIGGLATFVRRGQEREV